jgi:hypothetical protein
VRGLLRYNRTSAGTTDRAADWHLGQIIFDTSGGPNKDGTPNKKIEGVIQHNGITEEISTGTIWGMNESNIKFCQMEVIFVK